MQTANPSLSGNRAHTYYEDPVAAYDALASRYVELRRRRAAYLQATETIIMQRIPPESRSLLDVGAGDGRRAWNLAEKRGIQRVVLVEPSSAMILPAGQDAVVWRLRAEQLPTSPKQRFDIILCLWNVLGHIANEQRRKRALCAIRLMLSSRGLFFLDVTHRYNLRSYGVIRTGAGWVRDLLAPAETNGDVQATWHFEDSAISTYGHVFTHKEILRLARSSGLELEERMVVDYQDGRLHRASCLGNLVYVFRRSSRIDSSSATETS